MTPTVFQIFSGHFATSGFMIRLSVPEILQPGFFVTDGQTEEELGILVVGLCFRIDLVFYGKW